MAIKFDLEEMKLRKSFKRLIDFATNNGFSQSWNRIYVIEEILIKQFYDSDKKGEIPKSALIEFDTYEKDFDENLLKKGYSWINLSLLGILSGDLILTIAIPQYNNHLEFTHVNLSHSALDTLKRDLSLQYKIVD